MDDRTLMDVLDRDESEWYAALIDTYTAYVTAIIGGMAKGAFAAADIEEVAADVFFKVWKSRERIRAGNIKPLIAKIARNTCIDRLRVKGAAIVPYDDDILQVAGCDLPDELAIAREQAQIIQRAVTAFREPDREIFIRFYYFGETIAAIAGRLELNTATAKTKLHRLREKLREMMRERGYGDA